MSTEEGSLESVVELLGVELPVPDYMTITRRQAGLELSPGAAPAATPRHIVIDTTGLRVFGAGEWTIRKHGVGRGRRRTWRKLHLGVDEASKEIVAVDLTTSGVHDSPHLPVVLEQVRGDVGQVSGDRAYDSGTCYQAIVARGAVPTIPPRRNAKLSRAKDPPPYRVEPMRWCSISRRRAGTFGEPRAGRLDRALPRMPSPGSKRWSASDSRPECSRTSRLKPW